MHYITKQKSPNNSTYSNILSYKAPINITNVNMQAVTIKFFLWVILVFPQTSSKKDNLRPA